VLVSLLLSRGYRRDEGVDAAVFECWAHPADLL
jgi:hypothetical protein